jgi:hypothetical protein
MLDSFEAVAIIAVSVVQTPAQVAKLVDALGSGPSGGNTVEVRVLSWAPDSKAKPLPSGFAFCVRLCGSFELVRMNNRVSAVRKSVSNLIRYLKVRTVL